MNTTNPTKWKTTPCNTMWHVIPHQEAAPDELFLTYFDRSAYEATAEWRYKRMGTVVLYRLDGTYQLFPVFVKREEMRKHGFKLSDEPRNFRYLSKRRIKKAVKKATMTK